MIPIVSFIWVVPFIPAMYVAYYGQKACAWVRGKL